METGFSSRRGTVGEAFGIDSDEPSCKSDGIVAIISPTRNALAAHQSLSNGKSPIMTSIPLTNTNTNSTSTNVTHLHRHNKGHKRAKSTGSYSFTSKDMSIYTSSGLYAHQGVQANSDCHLHGLNLTSKSHSIPKSPQEVNFSIVKRFASKNDFAFNENADEEPNETDQPPECGFLSFRPTRLQKMATIQVFVFFSCVLVTLQQALSSGYFNSVITTIEKRFDVPSKMSGAIVSTFELGNLLTIIFVSYFGTHRHIPVWIGKGILVTGVGSLIFAIPHFMNINNPLDNVNVSGPLDDNTCSIPSPALSSPVLEKASHFINPSSPLNDPTCQDGGTYKSPHIVLFMLAMILIGCGGTPIFTLGTTYIDDHVKKESSSMYIGCMYSMVAFGLVVGFLLGGFFITVHENSFGSGTIPMDIYPGHPRWIGAWWAGFILLGILLILAAIPFFAFPKNLRKNNSEKHQRKLATWEGKNDCQQLMNKENNTKLVISLPANQQGSTHISLIDDHDNAANNPNYRNDQIESQTNQEYNEYGRKMRDIPSCMWRLVSNPVYITTCLGSCMELSIVSGFLIFLPKYLETQFTMSKSQANLFAGGIAVPGACVGIFLGGYLLKRFQMKPKGAIQFVLFFNLVCMGLFTALYFLGCDNVQMAGATLPYSNNTYLRLEPFQVNLTAECNMGCRCSPNDLEPICDTKNRITYYSPCFAGCKTAEGPRQTQNYSNCACISLNSTYQSHKEVTAVPLATAGPCPQMCQAMIPFMILLFIITLVVSITQMPLLMITLRSVAEEERAFALGMQFVIFRLFGYIPSPIVFGQVIDSTCIVWKANCGLQGGFCLMYNIEKFRLRYVGMCSGLKVAAGLLFFLDWLLICWRHKIDSKKAQTLTVGEIVSSIISLDRLSAFGWGYEMKDNHNEDEEELQPLGQDSDYNSANDPDEQELNADLQGVSAGPEDDSYSNQI